MKRVEFIRNTLNMMQIPELSQTNKSIINLIDLGYRNAGWSASGASKATSKYFPNKPKCQPLFTWLLLCTDNSYCSKCDAVLPLQEFTLNISTATGAQSYCRKCNSTYRRECVDTRFYNAKRNADILQRTPKWADLHKIKRIYALVPDGCHVDHIIPLKGELVSGLHVENNLQYLTAKDNMTKGNRYMVE